MRFQEVPRGSRGFIKVTCGFRGVLHRGSPGFQGVLEGAPAGSPGVPEGPGIKLINTAYYCFTLYI